MLEKFFLVMMVITLPIFFLSIETPFGIEVKSLEVVLVVTSLLCLPIWVIRRRFKLWGPLNLPISLFAAAITISAINSYHPMDSMKELIRYLVCFVFMMLFINLVGNRERVKIAIKSLFFISSLISVLGVIGAALHYAGLSNVFTTGKGRVGSTFGDPNRFGVFLYTPIALVLSQIIFNAKRNLRNYLALSILLLAILTTGSRGAIAGTIIIIIVTAMICLLKYNKVKAIKGLKFVFTVPFIMLILLYFLPQNLILGRLRLYGKDSILENPRIGTLMIGLKMFTDNPLFGVGIGGFSEENLEKGYSMLSQYGFDDLPYVVSPHNTYLSVLASGGLISFVAFLLILLRVSLLAMQNMRKSADVETYATSAGLFAAYTSLIIHALIINIGTTRYTWFLFSLIVVTNILLRKEQRILWFPNKAVVANYTLQNQHENRL